jgi:sigma-B regulation protein RsbU (phosphoserine phosphatase)
LLRTLADQVALAIENARLHKEAKEKERMTQELSMASRVQASLLPFAEPEVEGLEVSGANLSANEVGGDYYDYITVSESELGIAVGEVAGKGVPAAMVMSMIKGAFQSHLEARAMPGEMLTKLNKIAGGFGMKQLVTFFYCVLDSRRMTIRFCNAGHTFPYLVRNGTVQFIGEPAGLPLGADPGASYAESSLGLQRGDTVFLYTDGLTEARVGREKFGFDRLERVIAASKGLPVAEIKEKIIAETRKFYGNEQPSDDMTLVVCRIAGQLPA